MSAPRPATGHYWGPVVLWAGMIFALSAVSTFPQAVAPLFRLDKLAHAGEYVVLAFLIARAFSGTTTTARIVVRALTIVLTIAYGVSDEWHQSFVPGRTVSGLDLLADTTGGVLGQWLWFGIGHRTEQIRFGSPRAKS